MYCNNCGEQIPNGSRFCQGCGHPVGQAISTSDKKEPSKEIYYLVAILSLIFLAGFGIIWSINDGPLSRPPDRLILEWFQKDRYDPITNVKIASKGRCPEISPDAQALGLSQAWLIVIDYSSEDTGPTQKVILWGKQAGKWQPLWGNTCP